jgi:hypothetical protein
MSNVESPNHYTAGYIEVIYAIHDVLGREGFKAFCMGNYIKYNARANHKGLRAEDLAKADQYLEWATNGLPDPVDGRVPRKSDIYKQFAEAMRGPVDAGEAIHEAVDRAVKASPELGAGYGDAFPNDGTPMGEAYKALQSAYGLADMDFSRLEARVVAHMAAESPFTDDRNEVRAVEDSASARTVANAIGPVIQSVLGNDIFSTVRLRVTKDLNACEIHGQHIGFTAYVYDRKRDEEISRAIIMSGEPDEIVCEYAGKALANDIKHYFG